jgi:hypothetical protein
MRALIAEAGSKDQAWNPITSGAIDPRAEPFLGAAAKPRLERLARYQAGVLHAVVPDGFFRFSKLLRRAAGFGLSARLAGQ